MRTPLAVVCALLATAAPVAAQPGSSLPPAPPAPAPVPPPPPPDVGAAVDLSADYQRAFAALLASDFAGARAGFASIAAAATDPEMRGAARELARLADELAARQGRIVFGVDAKVPPGGGRFEEDHDEGRPGIIVTSTLASIYAGVVFSDLADTGDARAVTGIIVGTTGLGFLASLYGTRGRSINGGTAEAYSLGMLLGAGNGLLLASPLGADTSEAWNTTVLGSMAVVSGAGFYYGQTYKPTRGQVSFSGTLATMGIATVGLGLVIVQPDIDDPDPVLLAMTAGLDVGVVGGLVLGRNLTWSPGRARLVWLGALLGGLTGLAGGVLLFGDGESDEDGDTQARIAAGLTLAGAWGGLVLGARLTRNMKPDNRYRTSALDHVVPIALPHGAGLGLAGQF